MKRRTLLSGITATAAISILKPINPLDLFVCDRDVILPFIGGPQKVTILQLKPSLVEEAQAQYNTNYGYQQNYSYGAMAPYQQWYAYQQAVAQWQQQIAYWRQQQYYQWLSQIHMQRMQAMLMQYQQQQIGQPQVWPEAKSIYGYAQNPGYAPTMIGVNEQAQQVQIKDTLKGAAKIFDAVNQYYGRPQAEKTVGPQSSEGNAIINLPNNMGTAYGKTFDTKDGFVAVTNDSNFRSSDGQVGQLAKFVVGSDGEKYKVV